MRTASQVCITGHVNIRAFFLEIFQCVAITKCWRRASLGCYLIYDITLLPLENLKEI